MRIRRLVAQVDEQHREAMRTLADDLGQAHFGPTDAAVQESRRRFVRRMGLGGAVAVGAVAVPGSLLAPAAFAETGGGGGGASSSATEEEVPETDLVIARFAEGLELAAAAAYTVAVETRRLTSVEAEICRKFGGHHTEHAGALAALTKSKEDERTPNQAVVDALAPQLQAATTSAAVFEVLYGIEEGAAATYAEALGALESKGAIAGAASILPIESQHAVVIGELLDLPPTDWLPAFQTTTGAFDPAQYAG